MYNFVRQEERRRWRKFKSKVPPSELDNHAADVSISGDEVQVVRRDEVAEPMVIDISSDSD